jgi:hypothetical protein
VVDAFGRLDAVVQTEVVPKFLELRDNLREAPTPDA